MIIHQKVIKETFKFLYLGLGVLKFMVGDIRSLSGTLDYAGPTIEVQDFVRSPLQTAFSIALASILLIKWERNLAPIRRRRVQRNMAPLLPISTSRMAQSLLNRWLRQFMMVLLLNGTLLYSLLTLSPKPILVIRVQVVFFIKTCMVLGFCCGT
jgi:hypothetical protein